MDIAQYAAPSFDAAATRQQGKKMRKRILDVSQKLGALHIAPAFSCMELVNTIYFGLMRRAPDGSSCDTFILSKGHGAMAQFVALEELGVLTSEDIEKCCQLGGRLGGHPDYGLPGVEASTGSLGHGLPMALGMGLADKVNHEDRVIYVVMSDGELQEGSVWESLLLAPSQKLTNLVVFVDLNDFQSRGQTSKIHPNFYPVDTKTRAFGWETVEVDGHDPQAIYDAVSGRSGNAPMMVIGRTVKGKGVSYMENKPIWHYRSPNPEEYQQALKELGVSE
jgi:transketolase